MGVYTNLSLIGLWNPTQHNSSTNSAIDTVKSSIDLTLDLTELWRATQSMHLLWHLWILATSMSKIWVC